MSKPASFRIEQLSSNHDRSQFHSGSAQLDRYFREQVSQDVRRRVSACFVAVNAESGDIAGYYTLAATSVLLSSLPSEMAKKLPRYPVVPAVLVGRLAVGIEEQGKGLGSILIADAMIRAARAEFGVFAIVVDAKDESAQQFYEHLGFVLLAGEGRRLALPIATARRLV